MNAAFCTLSNQISRVVPLLLFSVTTKTRDCVGERFPGQRAVDAPMWRGGFVRVGLLQLWLAVVLVDAGVKYVAMFPKSAQYAGRPGYPAEKILLIVSQDNDQPMDLVGMGLPNENLPTMRISTPSGDTRIEYLEKEVSYINHTHIHRQEKSLIDFSRYQHMSAEGAFNPSS